MSQSKNSLLLPLMAREVALLTSSLLALVLAITTAKEQPLVVVSCVPIADEAQRSAARILATGALSPKDESPYFVAEGIRLLVPAKDPWFTHLRDREAMWKALQQASDRASIPIPGGAAGTYIRSAFKRMMPEVSGFGDPQFRFALSVAFEVSSPGHAEKLTWAPNEPQPATTTLTDSPETKEPAVDPGYPVILGPERDAIYTYFPDQKLSEDEADKAAVAALKLYRKERERIRQASSAAFRALFATLVSEAKLGKIWELAGRDVSLKEADLGNPALGSWIGEHARSLGFSDSKTALREFSRPGGLRLEPEIQFMASYRNANGQRITFCVVQQAPRPDKHSRSDRP